MLPLHIMEQSMLDHVSGCKPATVKLKREAAKGTQEEEEEEAEKVHVLNFSEMAAE